MQPQVQGRRGKVASWGIFQHGARSYDLSHLDERLIVVRAADFDHGILVRFSDHCFTVDAINGDQRPVFPNSSRNDGRFCEVRYQYSLGIWDLLAHAVKGKVWFGEDDRCLVVSLMTGEGDQSQHYIIPFTLERHKGHAKARLLMRVRSAFVRTPDKRIATYGEIKFATLIVTTLNGKSHKRIYDKGRKKPF